MSNQPFIETRTSWRRRARAGCAAATVLALCALSTTDLVADRRGSSGSARQSRNTSAARSTNTNRNTNANRNTNVNRNVNNNTNVNRNVNVNNNVNVNRNVNVNSNVNRGYGYPARGGVVVGEEGAVAVGRRGAVAVGEEGYVGVGRYGGVVAGEQYESHAGWAAAAGVATGIAIGTMLARPPAQSTTVVVSGANYVYSDGAYYESVMYGGEVQYQVVEAPAGAIITTLPGGCTTVVRGGVSYSQCGPTYYQRVSTGYRVVVF